MRRAIRLRALSSAYFAQLPLLSLTWQNVQSAPSDAVKNPIVSMNWLTVVPLMTWRFLKTASAIGAAGAAAAAGAGGAAGKGGVCAPATAGLKACCFQSGQHGHDNESQSARHVYLGAAAPTAGFAVLSKNCWFSRTEQNLLIAQEARVGQREVPVGVPGLRVRARIVDHHVELERLLVDALIALGQMQLLGVRMAHLIEPRLVVEADGVHDQRVAVLVVADRVPPPLRIRIGRMLRVQPHDPEERAELVQDVHGLGRSGRTSSSPATGRCVERPAARSRSPADPSSRRTASWRRSTASRTSSSCAPTAGRECRARCPGSCRPCRRC